MLGNTTRPERCTETKGLGKGGGILVGVSSQAFRYPFVWLHPQSVDRGCAALVQSDALLNNFLEGQTPNEVIYPFTPRQRSVLERHQRKGTAHIKQYKNNITCRADVAAKHCHVKKKIIVHATIIKDSTKTRARAARSVCGQVFLYNYYKPRFILSSNFWQCQNFGRA